VTVLTAGETMGLLDPAEEGPLRLGMSMTLRFAGAESNFAIALARLGVPVRWISRVGRDALGALIVSALEGEGVDIGFVGSHEGRTGAFVKWRESGRSRVAYYRAGSAASALCPADAPDATLEGVRLVHLTGITMALSDSARALVLDLARRAKDRGLTVVFDPNFRPALPDTVEAAAERQRPLLDYVDWYLCGFDEGNGLWRTASAADLARAIPVKSVIRLGHRGAVVDGEIVPPARAVDVVDEVGAGDAFAAGFAFGLLSGWTPPICVRAANLLAAHALAGTGDWETLPRLNDVRDDLAALEKMNSQLGESVPDETERPAET
jgi:2-dehydro-3-deoxygluconokinase